MGFVPLSRIAQPFFFSEWVKRKLSGGIIWWVNKSFFDLLMAFMGNLVSYLRAKVEIESVTSDTAFRFNSKDACY
jgi:hypothetical protein